MGYRTANLTSSIFLSSVLCLPKFSFNLLSVSKLTRTLNYSVFFFSDQCLFQDLTTKQIIGRGHESGGLYILENHVPRLLVCSSTLTPLEVHCRLGHPSLSTMKKLCPQFQSLSVLELIDFDNTDMAWRKYDAITARELFKQFGCSERIYRNVFGPLLQVGLFAPPEQCSAAATIGMLYFISLAHQKDFDMVWCRGTVRGKIFNPWMDSLRTKGCRFLDGGKMKDFIFNKETSCISGVVCSNETYGADAVILAVGISKVQELVKNSAALCTREEFLKVLNLSGIDLLTCKLQLDRKVNIPHASNVCSTFDDSLGWTFFDLNALHDEHKDSEVTTIRVDFYHANELLPLQDELVVTKVISLLSNIIKDFEKAKVIEKEIARFPKSLTHFFPGSYRHMMRGSTSFPNLFMAGDWIITRHGSWSQEKSYVTGLEAANQVVDFLEEGSFAKIIPVEEDEPHVQALRTLNRRFNEITDQFPLFNFFLQ
ncbi:uncharacterized protein LOC110650347 isoform X2 [Hevea brasiliensis]|uniref:uncharacterized protein LOC110650347 isoform X2 n=1 Tax=Hevea brasiliensis TaxID=3981 RepID=UPI0025EEB572|nr:uncharacterized protein LOC110650347 isoform X2 [Hevea brasiliensis]